MALDSAGLLGDLNTLFSGPPDSISGCAQAWGDLMESYSVGVIPPCTTVSAAASALTAELTSTVFPNSASASMIPLLETAFANFALVIAGGMAPTYIALPPAGLVGFASLTTASSHLVGAINFFILIDAWMKTGTATLAVPPFTAVTWT